MLNQLTYMNGILKYDIQLSVGQWLSLHDIKKPFILKIPFQSFILTLATVSINYE